MAKELKGKIKNIYIGKPSSLFGAQDASQMVDAAFYGAGLRINKEGSLLSTGQSSGRYLISSQGSFGGDGSDGRLIVDTNTTIDLGNAEVFTKNYTYLRIDSGVTLSFSNPATAGTLINIRTKGGMKIYGTIDADGMGGQGGATATAGTLGNGWYVETGSNGGGGATGGSGNEGSGGTAYAETFQLSTDIDTVANQRVIALQCGQGGGGGANGSGAGVGGAGGSGGAALYMECGGELDFTGTITVDGTAGTAGTDAAQGGGGGGGGSAGMLLLLYGSLFRNTGTVTAVGGAGGQGGDGSASSGSGGAGGGGAASRTAAGGNGGYGGVWGGAQGIVGVAAGGAGAGGGGGGGTVGSGGNKAGGSGGSTETEVIAKNIAFA